MSPILDASDASNLTENYPFDTKLHQLLFLLDNNLMPYRKIGRIYRISKQGLIDYLKK